MAVATGSVLRVPIEEYLSTSWDTDREYVDGRLVERNVGELDHSYLQGLLLKLLDRRGLFAFVELRVQMRSNRFRIPDVLAVRQMPSGRFLRKPPYIIVEVLSPDDRARDLDDRIDGRICHDNVATSDGQFSIPLSEIFADMRSTEDQ